MNWISPIQALEQNGLPLQRMCKIFCKGSRFCDSSIKNNLEERSIIVSANIAHLDPEDVAVGDLLVVPFDPLTND